MCSLGALARGCRPPGARCCLCWCCCCSCSWWVPGPVPGPMSRPVPAGGNVVCLNRVLGGGRVSRVESGALGSGRDTQASVCCSAAERAGERGAGGKARRPGPHEPLLVDGDAPPTLEEIQSWGQSFDRLMRSA
ncbi:PREDICTED: uncharacterized protein LOC106110400, partial [Papilio polytes]|uniref:uncharacterized protein LOC106110400 n=1 Tax=Papilio polytes TaxID=76194 RepID=UPI000675BCA1